MSGWPYPGDAPTQRARRVAHAYRAALLAADADVCAAIDAQMASMGQHWVVPRVVTYDPDDVLSAADAADVAAVNPATLRKWRERGLLVGVVDRDGWHYRARDVLALAAARRRSRPAAP
jgi:hypothetical protein